MATVTGICNSALHKIGQVVKITTLTDGTPAANVLQDQYAETRDRLLRAHKWNFATARRQLSQLSSTPISEYDYEYSLPADCIRVVRVTDNESMLGRIDYRIEGRKILTSAQTVYITYIKRETDPNQMPVDFREALAAELAVEVAPDVSNISNTKMDRLERRAGQMLRKAKSTDAMVDGHRRFPNGSWSNERFRNGSDDEIGY